jgi:hypothetical protein
MARDDDDRPALAQLARGRVRVARSSGVTV